ncbi:MAG TPA: SPW repeat protein [Gemmatimonadaceae bacterium]|nr:SPW repeat protein [Gemmatimonadaceae bacterium]
MRFMSTRAHGALDYVLGALLIAAPWILDFNRDGAETWVPVTLGIVIIVYSMFTDYETGMVHRISMPTHLGLDVAAGLFLIASPWLFDFDEYVRTPHVTVGVIAVLAGLVTQTVTSAHRMMPPEQHGSGMPRTH